MVTDNMKGVRNKLVIAFSIIACMWGCNGKSFDVQETAICIRPVGVDGTKAIPYTAENIDSIYVDCYFSGSHELFFSDMFVKSTDGTWSTSQKYYWPFGIELDFVFRTKIEAMDHYSYDPVLAQATFDYEAVEITDQKDMMVSIMRNLSTENCTGGIIDVTLYHTLAAVRFKIADDFPEEVIFNSVAITDMYATGICTFKAGTDETEISWKVSKLFKSDYINDYDQGRIIEDIPGIDGLIVGKDIMPGDYVDRNQETLGDTFMFIPDQKMKQFILELNTGTHFFKEYETDHTLECGKVYTFELNLVLNEVSVAGTSIIDWNKTEDITMNVK